jgi:hypothetical protein
MRGGRFYRLIAITESLALGKINRVDSQGKTCYKDNQLEKS